MVINSCARSSMHAACMFLMHYILDTIVNISRFVDNILACWIGEQEQLVQDASKFPKLVFHPCRSWCVSSELTLLEFNPTCICETCNCAQLQRIEICKKWKMQRVVVHISVVARLLVPSVQIQLCCLFRLFSVSSGVATIFGPPPTTCLGPWPRGYGDYFFLAGPFSPPRSRGLRGPRYATVSTTCP